MIDIYIVFLLLGLHFVSDFILQSDYMAKNKSTSNIALAQHIAFYSIPFIGWWLLLSLFNYGGNIQIFDITIAFILVNAVLHFITDYLTSRINAKLYVDGKNHEFFTMIGFDQLIHVTTLIATYYLMVM